MTWRASLQAWYILNISSLRTASSADSSIMSWVLPVAYKLANSSSLMNLLVSLMMMNMMALGTRSRQVLVMIFM